MTKSILLVNDDQNIREMVRIVLELEGYSVIEAANGEEALKKLEDNRVDLVISDMQMPVMNGWDFYDALKTNPRLACIPLLIFCAGNKTTGTPPAICPDGFLSKPIEIGDLLLSIKRQLSKDVAVGSLALKH